MHELDTLTITFRISGAPLGTSRTFCMVHLRCIYCCHDMSFSALFRTKILGYIPMFEQRFHPAVPTSSPESIRTQSYSHINTPGLHLRAHHQRFPHVWPSCRLLPPLRTKRLLEGPYGLLCMLSQLSSSSILFLILFLVACGTCCIRSRPSNDTSLRMARYGYGYMGEGSRNTTARRGCDDLDSENLGRYHLRDTKKQKGGSGWMQRRWCHRCL